MKFRNLFGTLSTKLMKTSSKLRPSISHFHFSNQYQNNLIISDSLFDINDKKTFSSNNLRKVNNYKYTDKRYPQTYDQSKIDKKK